MIFKLYKDQKFTGWKRLYYKVDAETLEEAVEKILDGDEFEYDDEYLYDEFESMMPDDNQPTAELYDENSEKRLLDNIEDDRL